MKLQIFTFFHYQNQDFGLIEEPFTSIAHSDERLRKARIIVCNVPCSKSAIVNPVDFVLQEGNEASKLLIGKVDVGKQKAIASDERLTLKHAFTFSQAQSILYFTQSVNSSENEDLVMPTLKEYREQPTLKNPFQLVPFLPDLVTNLSSHIKDAEGRRESIFDGHDEKYFKLRPSSRMNGCFVALLQRQYLEDFSKDAADRPTKKGAKSRATKKSLARKYSKDNAATKQEEISEEVQLSKKASDNKDGNTFHKFF